MAKDGSPTGEASVLFFPLPIIPTQTPTAGITRRWRRDGNGEADEIRVLGRRVRARGLLSRGFVGKHSEPELNVPGEKIFLRGSFPR